MKGKQTSPLNICVFFIYMFHDCVICISWLQMYSFLWHHTHQLVATG